MTPPGIGKTLTAEAVSEHLKRPLYSLCFPIYHFVRPSLIKNQIFIGELPIVAVDLEYQLTRIFKTVSHWNTILLLDEADVFLERRSSDNFDSQWPCLGVPLQTRILRENHVPDDEPGISV